MTAIQPTPSRSNKEVALAMLIAAIALLSFALVSALLQDWIYGSFVNSNSPLVGLWQFSISFAYSVGGPLLVGALIVSRLPQAER